MNVGFYGSAAGDLLTDVLRHFGERRPAVAVTVHELLLDSVDGLLAGNIDLAFTRLVPGQTEFEVEVLARESRVVALPRSDPLAGRSSLTFSDLRDESFITNPIANGQEAPARWLAEQRRHGLPGRVAAEAASIQEILTLVAAERGVCLMPSTVARHYPRDRIGYVPVTDADPAVISLAWRPELRTAAIDSFIRIAHEVAAAKSGDRGWSDT